MADGALVTGDDEEAVNTALKSWYAAHPLSKEKYELVYPVDVMFEDGETMEIVDEAEMILLKKECEGEKGGCFDLVYPVTYEMADGTTVMGDDEKAVETALKAWYTAHPDSKDEYELVYPVDVIFEDGETMTAANEAEMIVIKEDCEGDGDG